MAGRCSGTPRRERIGAGVASGECALQEHQRPAVMLLDEAVGVRLDHREGHNGWILPCEAIHGSLKRAAHTARRCRGQVRGDLVHQGAPEARTGAAWLTLLSRLYGKVVCFDVCNQLRGVHNRRHDIFLVPACSPYDGGCLLRRTPVPRTPRAPSREGQSSKSSLKREYDAERHKRKTHCFHKNQKKESWMGEHGSEPRGRA